MSLLSDIEANVQTPGSKCSVPAVLAALSPEEADELRTALNQRRYDGRFKTPASAISDTLRKRDLLLSDSTINRHRRGGCKCR